MFPRPVPPSVNAEPRFVRQHLDVFVQVPYRRQKPFNNISPHAWALKHLGLDRPSLARTPLDRFEVQQVCRPGGDVLDGYLSAMAWGAQEKGPGGGRKARTAWAQCDRIRSNLELLQREGLGLREAYELFDLKAKVVQLGPAYFTKLLYFFSPSGPGGPDRYIMDQWTGLSVNLLCGTMLVSMTSALKDGRRTYALAQRVTAANYALFCTAVDVLASHMNSLGLARHHTGEDVEQMLFSQGGRAREPWRQYVHANAYAHWPTRQTIRS